jgi:predicted DNA-binding protein (UPF0251 family)
MEPSAVRFDRGSSGSPPTCGESTPGASAACGGLSVASSGVQVPIPSLRQSIASRPRQALGPALTRALERLREADREVLLLYAWEDLTYEEIAQALGIPVGTVRSRLHRARTQLRELLSGSGQERGEGIWRASEFSTVKEPTDG